MRRGTPLRTMQSKLALKLAKIRQPTGRLREDVLKKSKEDVKKQPSKSRKIIIEDMKAKAKYKKYIKRSLSTLSKVTSKISKTKGHHMKKGGSVK